MNKDRLEAFSDGVIAIIITIMVLELRPPEGITLAALRPLAPVFLSYVISFIFLGVYWNNHHHLFQAVNQVNGRVLWANLHLLFWLSLVPFVTAWMGENRFARGPVVLYGVVMILAAIAYYFLTRALLSLHSVTSTLAKALGNDFKGRISIIIYAAALLLCLINPWLGVAGYVLVTIIWLIPDRRIESTLAAGDD